MKFYRSYLLLLSAMSCGRITDRMRLQPLPRSTCNRNDVSALHDLSLLLRRASPPPFYPSTTYHFFYSSASTTPAVLRDSQSSWRIPVASKQKSPSIFGADTSIRTTKRARATTNPPPSLLHGEQSIWKKFAERSITNGDVISFPL